MKTFAQLLAEVAQPLSGDELNFKYKHGLVIHDDPNATEDNFTGGDIRKFKNLADYAPGEDKAVYEAEEDEDLDDDAIEQVRRINTEIIRKRIDEAVKTMTHVIDWDGPTKVRVDSFDKNGATVSKIGKHGRIQPDEDMTKDLAPDTKEYKEIAKKIKALDGADDGWKEKRKSLLTLFQRDYHESEILGDTTVTPAGGEFDSDESHSRYKSRTKAEAPKAPNIGTHPQTPAGGEFDSDESHANYKRKNKIEAPKGPLQELDAEELEKFYRRFGHKKALKESVPFGSTFKLKDGATPKVSTADARALNALFDKLNPSNRAQMQSTLTRDLKGFNEILGFAKEAS